MSCVDSRHVAKVDRGVDLNQKACPLLMDSSGITCAAFEQATEPFFAARFMETNRVDRRHSFFLRRSFFYEFIIRILPIVRSGSNVAQAPIC